MARNINQLTSAWRRQTMLMKLIWVNAVVFALLHLSVIVAFFCFGVNDAEATLRLVEMPSSIDALLRRPWTLLTYMFAQYDVLHALFNMLWLYWFGIIFQSLSTGRRVLILYLYGGLAGAGLYLLAYGTLPVFAGQHGWLIGSSAAVIAIVTATAVMVPNYKMHLLFLGAVSLKWVAVVTIGLDLIGVTGANAGGHVAHLGGALMGAVFALLLRRGIDITGRMNSWWSALVNKVKGNRRRPQKAPTASVDDRKTLDAILDKIKKSGYASLTPEERKRLFDVSRRIK